VLRVARAKALSALSRLAYLQDEPAIAEALIEESLSLWHELDTPSGLAMALLHQGWTAQMIGDYEGAMYIYQKGLQILEPTNELWLRAQLLCSLAAAFGFRFYFEPARFFYQQSEALFEQLDDEISVADVLMDQGSMLIPEGSYTEAIACLLKSISLCYELGHKQFVTTGMSWLAFAIGFRGEPDDRTAALYTAKLQGAMQSFMDTIGMMHWARENTLIQTIQMDFVRV